MARNTVLGCKITRDVFFLEKKAPGRAAPHRRPSWGCTKTNPEWECSNVLPEPIQNGMYFKFITNLFQIYFRLTLDLHGSIFRKSSEKIEDMGLGSARVPKIIPMQVQGGLRGPSFGGLTTYAFFRPSLGAPGNWDRPWRIGSLGSTTERMTL